MLSLKLAHPAIRNPKMSREFLLIYGYHAPPTWNRKHEILGSQISSNIGTRRTPGASKPPYGP